MRFLTLILCLTFFAACEEPEPSPSAPTEPPVEEALDASDLPDSSATAQRYSDLMAYAREENLHERPIGEILQELGLQFRGRPYLVGPLDGFGQEVLVCRLDGFDCFTFLEAMLAAARGVAVQDYSVESYYDRTRQQRYRNGEMGGYCSRLHYYTEWIYDNEQKGIVENVTEEVGGEPREKQFGFMTANREEYPALEADSTFQCIQQVENRLNDVIDHFYIPQDRISESYDQLQAGDLIATTTDIEGLDVTHTGMVYKGEDGSTGLLHASTQGGVKISPDLQEYVQSVGVTNGIMVARALDPDAGAGSSTR